MRVRAAALRAVHGLTGLDALWTAAVGGRRRLSRPLALPFSVLLATSCVSATTRSAAGEAMAPMRGGIAKVGLGGGGSDTPPDQSAAESRRLLPLAELARTVIARRLGVAPERVTVDFEAPRAAHLLLPVSTAPAESSAAFRLESAGPRGEWMVVLDSVAGARPELRLPLRAQVEPARRTPSPQPRR